MIEKSTIIVFVFGFVFMKYSVNAGFTSEQIKQVGVYCNASDDDLKVALQYEVPTTLSGKCLMTCMLKQVKTLKEDGSYDKDLALQSLKTNWPEVDATFLEQLAEKCKQTVAGQESLLKTDPCEYGYKIAYCVNNSFKQAPEGQSVLEAQKKQSS